MIELKHDIAVDIATGRHRRETSWKNKELLWSALVNRLAETHRTAETITEYLAAKKPRQDEIKDVGGFVAGYLTGGRRKAGNVLHRSVLTLDADFANVDLWFDFTLQYGNAAAMYSTHKHTAKAPRFRLLLPLSRAVRPDEYEAIARFVAGKIDIEVFDPTTFQPERLMYWPSTSKDGEFVFEYQDGEILDADVVLSMYQNWQDTSEWPVSAKVDKIILRGIQKQGDPLEKPGIIGAFCRTYNIHEAIENFLTDEYDATDLENRYTFKAGSTGAGLVVYDDRFTYSHHGTDPTSGKLCNAFDLVRIHKFGLQDENSREDTPVQKRPSYEAMQEFCTKDEKVRRQLGAERLQDAVADFSTETEGGADMSAPEGPENNDWIAMLDVDKKGNYYNTIANVSIILENDPNLKGRFALDDFTKKKTVLKNLPWRKMTAESRFIKDEDEQNLLKYLERVYNITNRANIKDAFDIYVDACAFHPVRDYLNGLAWDKKHRVDRLFIDYMGAEDSAYMRAVARKSLVACVARVMDPGVKFDYMPVLIGDEGKLKSSLIATLGGAWFSDSFSFNMLSQGNKAYEQTIGYWIIEVAELSGLKSSEVEAVKHFMSKREDSFRPAYGRNMVTYRRQWVPFGSTNNWDFLVSKTGNRRFWPVVIDTQPRTKDVSKHLTAAEVGQVWAEALVLYKAGEPLYLDAELEAVAREVQKDHNEADARIGIIEKYLNTLLPANWDEYDVYRRRGFIHGDADFTAEGTVSRTKVCAAEIWCEALKGREEQLNRQITKELNNIVRNIDGWVQISKTERFGIYGVQRGFEKVKSRFLKCNIENLNATANVTNVTNALN